MTATRPDIKSTIPPGMSRVSKFVRMTPGNPSAIFTLHKQAQEVAGHLLSNLDHRQGSRQAHLSRFNLLSRVSSHTPLVVALAVTS